MRWLTRLVVEALHARLIDLFGGSHGLRDPGLLESALAQPQASFGGVPLHNDVWEMAAAYGFHLCCNHPFVDGNKRIAAVAMITFLRANGQHVRYDEVALYRIVVELASGQVSKAQLAVWLREHAIALR